MSQLKSDSGRVPASGLGVAHARFKAMTTDFLRNFKAENYKSHLEELLNVYRVVRWKVSLKIHTLASAQLFQRKLGAVSDEHGEFFHL
jgi:hypothetical protein